MNPPRGVYIDWGALGKRRSEKNKKMKEERKKEVLVRLGGSLLPGVEGMNTSVFFNPM